MDDLAVVGLAPERFAGLVAPVVDRVHRAVHDRSRDLAGAAALRESGAPRVGLLLTLRFALLGGGLPRAAFPLASRYDPADGVLAAVDDLVAGGWLVPDDDDVLRPDERAAALLHRLYDLHAQGSAGWPADLAAPVATAGRLLDAAAATGGPAFTAFAPPFERRGDPPGVLLFNRLAALRYHRSDAHAAAWAARGLTAAEVVALPADTPVRREIEADTDRRAAPPYAALTPAERLAFLAALAALD